MSAHGASSTSAWCVRLLLAVSLIGLGGCWGGDLARKDREVRASWAALQAADAIAFDLAQRVDTTWRRSAEKPVPADRFLSFIAMNRRHDLELSDAAEVGRYAAARSGLISYLRKTAETLASPSSANLAWKLRRLRLECNAALLRADNALVIYNDAVHAYNRALHAKGPNVSKALLFPGRRQFALLDTGQTARPPRRQ